jgi:hypothetical protein
VTNKPTIGTSTLSTTDLDARGITTANKAQTGDSYPVVTSVTHGNAALLADICEIEGGGGETAEAIYTYFTAGSRADAFKANVTGLATTANQTIIINHLTGIKGAGWVDQNLVQIAADAATAVVSPAESCTSRVSLRSADRLARTGRRWRFVFRGWWSQRATSSGSVREHTVSRVVPWRISTSRHS